MIQQAFIIAFICLFLKASTWRGMIFEWVNKKAQAKLPEKLYKPFIGCLVCLTPYWGFVIYSIGHFCGLPQFANYKFIHVLFVLFTATGINTIFLMMNKFFDVATKQDKLLKKELEDKNIK